MVHHRKNRWLYGLMAGITAVGVNLATPTVSQAGFLDNLLRGVLIWGVQSYQLSSLSDRDEMNFGQQIHDELIGSQQISLYKDQAVVNYVSEIGERLVPYSTRPDIDYQFFVVDDDSINAFATMGGYVYVNTGLIQTADNEAELASVISHEIVHIAEKHAIQQMKTQARNQGILAATGLDSSQIVQLGVTIALDYPHSRSDENEADSLGFDMLTKAGYAPEAMASFMRKLQAASGGGTPTFLSTHPATGDRVAALEEKAELYRTQYPNQTVGLDSANYRKRMAALM